MHNGERFVDMYASYSPKLYGICMTTRRRRSCEPRGIKRTSCTAKRRIISADPPASLCALRVSLRYRRRRGVFVFNVRQKVTMFFWSTIANATHYARRRTVCYKPQQLYSIGFRDVWNGQKKRQWFLSGGTE